MKKNSFSKRIWAILIAVILVIGLVPTATAVTLTPVSYIDADGVLQTCEEYTIVDSGTVWTAGWYVVSGSVTVSERIVCSGSVYLILLDDCLLNAESGINVASGQSLTICAGAYDEAITGTGSLNASAQDNDACIGGGDGQSSGPITINGGTVTAVTEEFDENSSIYVNNEFGAGIGGGKGGNGSNITINGGTVTANGGTNAAGIGGGKDGNGTDITINGGDVTVQGGFYAAGIGGGEQGNGSDITINGGTVLVNGGAQGAGIGGGQIGNGTDITINGGIVTATGGSGAAGIGGGYEGYGMKIAIYDGTVTANGGNGAAGIGGGSYGYIISINGGIVTATGGSGAAGIGGGKLAVGANISINGGIVTATGGSGAAGIGGGSGATVSRYRMGQTLEELLNYVLLTDSLSYVTYSSDTEDNLLQNVILPENRSAWQYGTKQYFRMVHVATGPVDYLDENGARKTCADYTVIDSGSLILSDGGWYTAYGKITIPQDRRMICQGDVHLILLDGCVLDIIEGINVAEGSSLTIYSSIEGTGILKAEAESGNAAIGGGYAENSGRIIINGGTVSAKAGDYAASIGGGEQGNGSDITINGGTVNAQIDQFGTGIGGGFNGNGSNIIINGGIVTAVGCNGAAIGGGYRGNGSDITINGGTVIATSLSGGAAVGGGDQANGSDITINGGTVIATAKINAAGIGGGDKGAGTNIKILGGTVRASGSENGAGIGNGPDSTAVASLTFTDSTRCFTYNSDTETALMGSGVSAAERADILGKGTKRYFCMEEYLPVNYLDFEGGKTVRKTCTAYKKIPSGTTELESGWYVADASVTLPEFVDCSGDVHLILVDGYTLTAEKGINVVEGNSLTIYEGSFNEKNAGTGSLIANGEKFAPGIGVRSTVADMNSGAIKINGGRIYATGGECAAGIGGGVVSGNGTNITINGGSVTANGGKKAAGIGGGEKGSGSYITVNGGIVTATGGEQGAGIGGGNGGNGSYIFINGGTVTAIGGELGAGIGGGFHGEGSNITIKGGTVTSTGGEQGAGIGGGYSGNGSYITVNGGTVNAFGGIEAYNSSGGAGIGGGHGAEGTEITINGGIVTATGRKDAAGIGSSGHPSSDITINGGIVTATGGENAAGIGGGNWWNGSNIVINGGIITATGGSGAAGIGGGSESSGSTVEITQSDAIYVLVGDTEEDIKNRTYEVHPTERSNCSSGTPRFFSMQPVDNVSISVDSLDFGAMPVGYTQAPAAKTITVTNDGLFEIELSLPASTNYTIIGGAGFENGSPAVIEPNKTASFTVQPKSGLDAGNWDEMLAVKTVLSTNSVSLSFGVHDSSNHTWVFTANQNVITASCVCGGEASLTLKPETFIYDGQAHTLSYTENISTVTGITPANFYAQTSVGNYTADLTVEGATAHAALIIKHPETEFVIEADLAEKTYDGTPLFGSIIAPELPVGYYFDELSTDATVTHVYEGDVDVHVDHLVIRNADGEDVTDQLNIKIIEGAVLKIHPATLLVTTGSAEKLYDGSALTNSEAEIKGLVDGETATVTATGSQKEAGSSLNTYSITYGSADPNDYTVEADLGTLKVISNALTEDMIDPIPAQSYTGGPVTPDVKVKFDGTELIKGTDYVLSYEDNVEAGTAKVIVAAHPQSKYTGSVVVNFVIGAINATKDFFTVSKPSDCEYDGNPHKAVVSLNGPYSGCDFRLLYKNGNGTLCEEAVDAGTYTVFIDVLNSSNNFSAGIIETTDSFTIAKASGSITAPTAKEPTYTGSALELVSAGSSTTGTVQYRLEGGTYGAEIPTATDAGKYTVWYKSVGDSNHNDTAEKSVTVTVAKADGDIVAPTAKELTYTGSALKLVDVGSSTTGTVQYKLEGGTYGAEIPTATDAGKYTVWYKSVGDNNHNDTAEKSVTVTVAKADGDIVAPTAKKPTYTGSALELVSAGSSTTGTVQYKLEGGTYGTVIPTATDAGTYTVWYKSDGDNNHNDTAEKSVTVTVAKAGGDIVAPTAKEPTYTGSVLELVTAGSSTTGTVQYKLGTDGTYGSAIPTATDAGTYTVYYKSVGDNNHNDTAEKSVTVTVAKADGEIGAPTAKELTYTGSALELVSAGSSSTGTVEYRLGEEGTYATAVPTATEAGEYTVWYRMTGDANHNDKEEKSLHVSIAKADGEMTAPAANELTYTGSALELVAAGNSSTGTVEYRLGENGTYGTEIPTAVDAGTYTVYYKSVGDDNHNDTAEESVTVAIAKADGEMTAPAANELTYDGSAQELVTAGSSATGTVQYRLDSGTYGTEIPTATDAGIYTVWYKSVGDDNHNDTAEESVTVTIAKADGEMTAPAANDLIYTGSEQELVAAGNSETGTVEYRLGEDGTFGTEIPTATAAGEYTVYYRSVGDDNHNDTAEDSLTVTVSKATPDVTAPNGLTCMEGKTLADISLPDGFVWVEDAATSVGSVGDNTFHVRYTPADTDNYSTVDSIAVTVAVTAIPEPVITEGAGQEFDLRTQSEMTFRCDASFDSFIRVEVDGVVLDEDSYLVKEGSIIVTLKDSFLRTLSNGEHTLRIVTQYGNADTTFTIMGQAENPPAGDEGILLWVVLLLVSVTVMAGTVLYGKKKRIIG